MKKNWLDYFEEVVSVVSLIFMTIITFVNIVSRFALHMSLSFVEELTVNLFVLMSFFGASIAAKRRAHLGLSVLTDRFPLKVQAFLELGTGILSCFIYMLIAWFGVGMMRQQIRNNQISSALLWPMWLFSSFVVVGSVVLAVRFIITAYLSFKNKMEKSA